ncbi:helix-turn-helix transcriptional regulator [Saccharicrinis aurantiacus]|uniref:helix-turn-helix transcriptional regulator n=1 Tax=Saccharicrinis aurantiacus TaxID=1849719 RepID=UPI002492F7D2|nr:hypothetical protein [Saccharicrinis aurantiacus]
MLMIKLKNKYTVLILTLYTLSLGLLHGQQFNHFLEDPLIKHNNISSEELMTELSSQLEESIRDNDSIAIVQLQILLSNISRTNLKYGKAFDYAGEALFLAEETNNDLLIAKANEEYGILCYLFKQDKQTGDLFKKAHQAYLNCYLNNEITIDILHRSYYNLLLYYQNIRDKDNTQAYIDTCSAIADTADIAPIYSTFLKEKKSSIYNWEKNFAASGKLLSKAIDELEQLEKDSHAAYKNNDFLTVLYAGMAIYHSNVKDFNNAQIYFKKALAQKDVFGEYTFYKEYIYRRYAWSLYKNGDYKESYLNSERSRKILDNYLNPRSKSTQGFISLKNRYTEELRLKNNELHVQQLELAMSKQRMLVLQIIFIVFIALIIVAYLVILSKKRYHRYQKEKQLNEKKHKQSQDELEHKNKELTTSILQLVEKEEIIKRLSNELKENVNTPQTKVLLKSIEKQSGNLWDAFNSRFVEQNESFYEKLKLKAPNLSPNDLKLCALLKLNFSGKEMAYLLGISHGSVNVACHRLRKKLDIDKEVRLSSYINSL